MMKEISFTVDKDLRIRSWNDDLRQFTGEDEFRALGKVYTEIFPKFLLQDKEAVSEAFRRGKTVILKQSRFQCLAHHRQADITISPLQCKGEGPREVEIVLQPSEPCSVGRQLIDAQKLIAIGKIAATLAHGVRNPLNAIRVPSSIYVIAMRMKSRSSSSRTSLSRRSPVSSTSFQDS